MNLLRFALIGYVLTVIASSGHANDVFTVKLESIEDRKAVLGTVQTLDLTPARARIGGTVTELLVDEGSKVRAGEVIARIKDEKLLLEIQAVQARIASLQAEYKLADIALKRAAKLRKSGAGSQARLDEARTNLDVVAKNLKAMKSERELVLQREREGAVLSPANGRVITVKATEGVVTMPGEALAFIAEETYILRLEVPERHARFIRKGDEVQIGERGMKVVQTNTRKGRIRQVYPEMIQGRVVADVDVDDLGDFFIGERIRVFVSTGKRDVYLVPEGFIYSRYGLNFVRLENGHEIVVQPGRIQNGKIEVLSGLMSGDVIVKVKS